MGKASGASIASTSNMIEDESDNDYQQESKSEPRKMKGEAFTRVNDDYWRNQIKHKEQQDNSYEAVFGEDGYGAKASSKLLQTRGKSFRHEKTKAKRGSYRGGKITLASNSFKYPSDSE